ncbi:MAG: hypothetical protein AABY22_01215, partial [Nanoarchaeota archaeon]
MANFNNILTLLNIKPSGLRIFYDFSFPNSGTTIPSELSGQSTYSGLLSSPTGNFYRLSGSGFFSGQNIQVQNASTGLNSKAFSHIIIYEKSGISDSVFVSTYSTGLIDNLNANLGYLIGMTAGNQPYFEYFNRGVPDIKLYSRPLGTKGAFAVTRLNNRLGFAHYDFSQERLYSQSYTINSDCLFDFTGFYLGRAITAPSYFAGNFFQGYLESYAYFNVSLDPTSLFYLFSGSIPNAGGGGGNIPINSMDTISYLRSVDSGDVSNLITHTGRNLGINKIARFNAADGYFYLDGNYTLNDVNLYVNSLAQLGSGFAVTGSVCITGIELSGDFTIIKTKIESTGFYDFDDVLIYDIRNGNRIF